MTSNDRSTRRDDETPRKNADKPAEGTLYERMRAAMGAPSVLDDFAPELNRLERVKRINARELSSDEMRAQDLRAQALQVAATMLAGETGLLVPDVVLTAEAFLTYIKTGAVPTP